MRKNSIINGLISLRPPSVRPVVIVGNGRSGTSWVGETLGKAPDVIYYREPCNPSFHGIEDDSVWSRFVPVGGNDEYFDKCLEDAFAGLVAGSSGRSLRQIVRQLARPYRVIVKDIAAYPSLEWLYKRWNPMVLIIIRHPCDYVLSVRAAGLDRTETGRLRGLIGNERLRDGVLRPYLRDLEAVEGGIETSAAIWGIKNLIVADAMSRNSSWKIVNYDDLCRDPVREFEALYSECGLTWTAQIKEWVRGKSELDVSGTYNTSRVSSRQIGAWRKRTSPDEVDRLRRVLDPLGLPFFSLPEDW